MTRPGFARWSVATAAMTALALTASPASAQTEVAKLLPADGASTDFFGEDVDICGGVAVIGARQANAPTSDSGAAYIFRQTGATWAQETKLTASDGASGDQFGTSVAICVDTAVIGSPRDDDAGSSSGSAYVYEYDTGLGAWQEVAKLVASDAAAGDDFGTAVALDGDVIAVGALDGDIPGTATVGTVYVYRRNMSGVWVEEAELFAADATGFDDFGIALAVDGDTIVVGSRLDDDNGSSSGSAYVFMYDGNVWSQSAKLIAPDGASGDQFGFTVSVSGDSVAVGSYLDDDAGSSSGAAYVYRFDGGGWPLEQKVTANDAASGDNFGRSVAIDDDALIVGSYLDAGQTGSVYVFERTGTTWSQSAKMFASDAAGLDQFGVFVSIDGIYFVAGAAGNDDNGSSSGAAYIFELTPVATDTTPPTATQGPLDAAYYETAAAAEAAAIAATTDRADDQTAVVDLDVTALAFGTCDTAVVVAVTDLAGNSATFFYPTTIDGDAPVVTAPADASVTVVDPNAPVLPADAGGSATAADACDAAPAVSYSDLVIPATESTPTQIVRTWTAADACGNNASEDQTITVELADTDGDGLTDFDETTIHGTDPALADTDADGLDDGEEIEIAAGGTCPDALVADSDGDTLLDGDEITFGTSACDPDTDGDGVTDLLDPLPTEPGVTTEFIAEQISGLATSILDTDFGAFKGRRTMQQRARRAILWWIARRAEHAMTCDRPVLARRLLLHVLWRMDGENRPRRDWVVDQGEADSLAADAELLIFLLDTEIGQ